MSKYDGEVIEETINKSLEKVASLFYDKRAKDYPPTNMVNKSITPKQEKVNNGKEVLDYMNLDLKNIPRFEKCICGYISNEQGKCPECGSEYSMLVHKEEVTKMKFEKDTLGNRMKGYEKEVKPFLKTKTPVIIRLDGKAFHTFTRGLEKPFDKILVETMQETMRLLCENIQGCKLGYTQSDEITLLLTDWEKEKTNAFFDYNLQKITSVTASMATLYFNKVFANKVTQSDFKDIETVELYTGKINKAIFDSRAFNVPLEEVTNSFIWRQQDAIKNSITMVASAYFSHKELHGMKSDNKKDMLETKGVIFDELPTVRKRGTCAIKTQLEGRNKWVIDEDIPAFTQVRDYIEKLLK